MTTTSATLTQTPSDRSPLSPEFLTADAAADILSVRKNTFYRWLRKGYLPHHRFGRLVRIRAQDVAEFIAKNAAH